MVGDALRIVALERAGDAPRIAALEREAAQPPRSLAPLPLSGMHRMVIPLAAPYCRNWNRMDMVVALAYALVP